MVGGCPKVMSSEFLFYQIFKALNFLTPLSLTSFFNNPFTSAKEQKLFSLKCPLLSLQCDTISFCANFIRTQHCKKFIMKFPFDGVLWVFMLMILMKF